MGGSAAANEAALPPVKVQGLSLPPPPAQGGQAASGAQLKPLRIRNPHFDQPLRIRWLYEPQLLP